MDISWRYQGAGNCVSKSCSSGDAAAGIRNSKREMAPRAAEARGCIVEVGARILSICGLN